MTPYYVVVETDMNEKGEKSFALISMKTVNKSN